MGVSEIGSRESISMLSRTESIAHVGSWEWDIAADRVHWSRELFRLFGLDPICGAPPFSGHDKLFIPEDMGTLSRAVELCRTEGAPFLLELGIRRSDGAVRRCISRGEAVRDDTGQISRLVGSLQDVTELLEAREEIRRHALRLEAIVDILQYRPDNLQDLLTRSLDKAVDLTGSRIGYIYSYDEDRREFNLNTWSRGVLAECAVPHPQTVHSLETTGIWGEAVRQRRAIVVNDFEAPNPLRKGVPEGHVSISRFLTVPVLYRDRIVAVVGVADKASDYTETDRLELTLLMDAVWKAVEAFRGEEALRRMDWLLARQSVADTGSFVPPYGDVAALNTDGLILSSVGKPMLTDIVSDSISLLETSAAVYEHNGDYALLHLCSDWCRLLDAASRRLCRTEDNGAALADGRWLCHETCWNHAARAAMECGRPVDIQCPGLIRLYALPILSGGKAVGAIHFAYGDPPRDPAQLRQLAERFEVDEAELARSAERYEPRPPFIVEVARKQLEASARLIGEIVQRRQTEVEREKFRAQLLQVQKMESVGRLAGGVAHDFNNALNVILGYSEEALERIPEPDPLHADLEEIHRAARHSAGITRQLLGFARRQPIHPETLDLNSTLERMLRMLEPLLGEDVLLDWNPAPGLWPVAMDPSQVEQILANLCINARDAIEGTGCITIKTANVQLEGEAGAAPEGRAPGDYVLLSISDTGCGMDRKTLDNLFEPFFTTKGPGKGTGLGLATVYGIVRQNRGFIQVDSRPGSGSLFRVYLPREQTQIVLPAAKASGSDRPSAAFAPASALAPTSAPASAPTFAPAPACVPASALASAPAPAFAPTSAPASAPTFAPALASAPAPTFAPASAPASVPTFAPALASAPAPTFAPASALAPVPPPDSAGSGRPLGPGPVPERGAASGADGLAAPPQTAALPHSAVARTPDSARAAAHDPTATAATDEVLSDRTFREAIRGGEDACGAVLPGAIFPGAVPLREEAAGAHPYSGEVLGSGRPPAAFAPASAATPASAPASALAPTSAPASAPTFAPAPASALASAPASAPAPVPPPDSAGSGRPLGPGPDPEGGAASGADGLAAPPQAAALPHSAATRTPDSARAAGHDQTATAVTDEVLSDGTCREAISGEEGVCGAALPGAIFPGAVPVREEEAGAHPYGGEFFGSDRPPAAVTPASALASAPAPVPLRDLAGAALPPEIRFATLAPEGVPPAASTFPAAPPLDVVWREMSRGDLHSAGGIPSAPTVSGPARSADAPAAPSEAVTGGAMAALFPACLAGGAHPVAPPAAAMEIAATPRGEEMVLLVEDEPAVLRLAKRMIERLGYPVIDAGSPGEALELARRHAPRLKLLVTDVIMPEMNGRALAERLQPLRPGLKVLFMSGYTADVIARSGMLEPGTHFIQKPFSRQDLSAKIREALQA